MDQGGQGGALPGVGTVDAPWGWCWWGHCSQAPSAAEPPARGHKREGSARRGTGQGPHAWYPHGDNDTPCTSLGVPGPPPLPSQTPAPAGSSPCPAQLHQGANSTGQAPAPPPQTPHQPQTTSYGARGCSPHTSRHRNPKSIPPTPRGSARTTSPQLPALGAPAARQLPHYYSAQSLPNNRRIVAGGSKKTPTGSCSGTTERVPVPRGCAITDPKTFSLQQPHAGLSTTLGRERGWHHRHSSAPAPRALGEAPEGQEGFGDGPARPARPLQGCPLPSQRGRPGAGVGVGARRGAPEPSSEARRCTAETWEEPGVAFSLLSARFHGEHTLYSECHHFPWIVGQRERENDSPSRAF